MFQIKSFEFSPIQENTYLLYNELNECIIVDPGCYFDDEKQTLHQFVNDNHLTPDFPSQGRRCRGFPAGGPDRRDRRLVQGHRQPALRDLDPLDGCHLRRPPSVDDGAHAPARSR